MSYKFCGMLPPRDEMDVSDGKFLDKLTPCIRRSPRHSEHIFKKHDGKYVSFEEDWTCSSEEEIKPEEDLRYVRLWDLNTKYAEEILASEQPVH